MDNFDVLIIGAGFSGATVARKFADAGLKSLVVEKEQHIAGHVYDELHPSGVVVQKFGPHIFHTFDFEVFEFLKRFGTWKDFHLEVQTFADGQFLPMPFNNEVVRRLYPGEKGVKLLGELEKTFPGETQVVIRRLLDSDSKLVREYAEKLWEIDYKPYTAKQWGIPPEQVDVSVLDRVPVTIGEYDGYFKDPIQAMPVGGFTAIIKNMLDSPLITVELENNALDHIGYQGNSVLWKGNEIDVPLVFTGPLDSLLDYKFGRLPYRSLRFEYEELDTRSFQPAAVVAYPQEPGYTRITEYTKLPIQDIGEKTVIAKEFSLPASPDHDPYYPIRSDESDIVLAKYQEELKKFKNLHLVGRLAEFKYFNMDTTVRSALDASEKILKN